MADEVDLLWEAVAEAMSTAAQFEQEWETNKLEKRIRDYFKKAAKTLDFRRNSWQQLVNDYADSVFGSLFQALSDREWITQVDFVLVLDAGIKQTFPRSVLRDVEQHEFECTVLAAHDRAFEEQRYLPLLWETVQNFCEGKATTKKVYNAADHGRKAATSVFTEGTSQVKEFVSRWIDATICRLSHSSQGYPETVLSKSIACKIFHTLIQDGALPIALLSVIGGQPPRNWPFVDFAVQSAYASHSSAEDCGSAKRGGASNRGKGRAGKGGGKAPGHGAQPKAPPRGGVGGVAPMAQSSPAPAQLGGVGGVAPMAQPSPAPEQLGAPLLPTGTIASPFPDEASECTQEEDADQPAEPPSAGVQGDFFPGEAGAVGVVENSDGLGQRYPAASDGLPAAAGTFPPIEAPAANNMFEGKVCEEFSVEPVYYGDMHDGRQDQGQKRFGMQEESSDCKRARAAPAVA